MVDEIKEAHYQTRSSKLSEKISNLGASNAKTITGSSLAVSSATGFGSAGLLTGGCGVPLQESGILLQSMSTAFGGISSSQLEQCPKQFY